MNGESIGKGKYFDTGSALGSICSPFVVQVLTYLFEQALLACRSIVHVENKRGRIHWPNCNLNT